MTENAAMQEDAQGTPEASQPDLDGLSVMILPMAESATGSDSAGALLKRLREQAGWSIESLSGALKVPVKTLHALEANDMARLYDVVFSRALAASVCRTLKADAAPVLALMPQIVRSSEIVKPEASLNVPMGRSVYFSGPMGWLKTKSAALVALMVLGILVLGNWPTLAAWWSKSAATGVEAKVASSPTSVGQVETAAAQALPLAATSAATGAGGVKTVVTEVLPMTQTGAGETIGPLVNASSSPLLNITIQASAPSWIEITDSTGKTLWRRLLDQGAPVQLTVPAGARMAVGNAAATRLSINGKSVELAAVTNANIARLELQ